MARFYSTHDAVKLLKSEGWDEAMLLRALSEVNPRTLDGLVGIGTVRAARALLRKWTDNKDLREAGLI